MHSKNVEKFGGALNVLEIDMDSNEKRKFRKRWKINGGESREIRPKIKNKDLVCIAAAAAIERCQFVLGVCLLFLFSFLCSSGMFWRSFDFRWENSKTNNNLLFSTCGSPVAQC